MLSLWKSAVLQKAAMAVSGIVLFGFVLGHMLGNLKLYLGAESLNHYAESLRTLGEPFLPHGGLLWIARFGLLVAVAVHVLAAYRVTRLSRAARPVDYKRRDSLQMDYASRTMRWGGVIILLFVFYHLAHFTWGWSWAHADFIPGDVYHNVVAGFSVWRVSLFYVVAQIALGFHLYHGLWSMFQSLGWSHPNWNLARRRFAQVFAWVITIVNISFPVAVLVGRVH